jgi:hypothetical protein
MQTSQPRRSYREELRERVLNRFPSIGNDEAVFEALFAFVSEVALESFKNGLSAGRRRSGGPRVTRERAA